MVIEKFPLTKISPEGKETYVNNPFTLPISSQVNLAYQFDIVSSGVELVSGGLRITNPDQFTSISRRIDLSGTFDFLTKGMRSGIYQHGGFAIGFERFLYLVLKSIDNSED